MYLFFSNFLLQAGISEQTVSVMEYVAKEESYLNIIMKGGWILLPLFLLSLVSVYVIIERWVKVSIAGRNNHAWFTNTIELIGEGKINEAFHSCLESPSPSAKVVAEGLKLAGDDDKDIEEAMMVESRQQMTQLDHQMNYLGIISSIAPMLGFLGTIFGVIKIFYNISVTNNLDIATISDGLYQKMICSGVGLLVGIIAYSGFYLINGKIDKIVARIDKDSNEMLRAIRNYKKKK